MLPGEHILFELIGSLYEAAACPERWGDFLRLAVQRFAAERAGLTLHSDRTKAAVTIHGVGFPAEATREYNAYYGARNPLVGPYTRLVRKSGAWHGLARSVVGEHEYKATEFYTDFGRKYGTYWVANALVRNSNHEVTTLSIMRSESAKPLDKDAVDLMAVLMPHLKRAFKIQHTVERLRSSAAATLGAVDALEAALITVDGNGDVVLINSGAENILREQDGAMLCGKQVAATDVGQARELDSLIQSAAATGAGRGLHPGGAMLLHREKRRPLRISVVPFHSSHILTEAAPCALIFISDPDAMPASRATLLAALYQLTPAESRLADFLLQGLEVAAAAERMQIRSGTARFMLKSIFSKTETHRQSELMRVLLTVPKAL